MSKDPSKMDEISSTERLLEVIRGNSSASQPGTAGHGQINAAGVSRRWWPVIKNPFPGRKQIVAGIDFGPGEVRLAKVSVGPDRKAQLLDLRSIPCPSQDSSNFSEFLRDAVLDFVNPSRNYSLWALAPSSHAEIRHLRVPKVSKKQIFNAVYWTMKKEVDFDDKSVFDFDVPCLHSPSRGGAEDKGYFFKQRSAPFRNNFKPLCYSEPVPNRVDAGFK
jgi:hypothetical protein